MDYRCKRTLTTCEVDLKLMSGYMCFWLFIIAFDAGVMVNNLSSGRQGFGVGFNAGSVVLLTLLFMVELVQNAIEYYKQQ